MLFSRLSLRLFFRVCRVIGGLLARLFTCHAPRRALLCCARFDRARYTRDKQKMMVIPSDRAMLCHSIYMQAIKSNCCRCGRQSLFAGTSALMDNHSGDLWKSTHGERMNDKSAHASICVTTHFTTFADNVLAGWLTTAYDFRSFVAPRRVYAADSGWFIMFSFRMRGAKAQ